MPAVRLILAAAFGVAAAPVLAQSGPDELWNMSMRMEMAGMPAQAINQQVCMQKGETQPEKMSQDKNCKVTDQRKVGNTYTWKIVCTGRDAMTGEGRMTRSGNAMDGRMRMQGKSGGEAMDMTIVYNGKLAGGCNAGERQQAAVKQQQAMIAQGEAQTAQLCKESMDKYTTMMFEMQGGPCTARKGEYCAHIKKTAQSMRSPAGYRAAMKHDGLRGEGWPQAAKFCSVQTAPIIADACKGAVGGRDWNFVGEYCPAESKQVAAEHCAGRDYTAAMASEYKAICGRYARRDAAPSSAAQAPAAPSAADAVKEGASQLRKLFGR